MVELRTIDTLTLVLELESRDGVKSTYVTEEEFSKIQVSKSGDKNFRNMFIKTLYFYYTIGSFLCK